jgi:serine/threonine protein kinase
LYTLVSGRAPFEASCGLECGWDKGEHCPRCAELLIEVIQSGMINFSSPGWDDVTEQCASARDISHRSGKDLVGALLRSDPTQRISTADLLVHDWFKVPHLAKTIDMSRQPQRTHRCNAKTFSRIFRTETL